MISALPVVGVDKIEAGVRPRMELPLHVLYLPTGEWPALPVHVHPYPLLQQAHIPLPTHTVGTVDFYILQKLHLEFLRLMFFQRFYMLSNFSQRSVLRTQLLFSGSAFFGLEVGRNRSKDLKFQ